MTHVTYGNWRVQGFEGGTMVFTACSWRVSEGILIIENVKGVVVAAIRGFWAVMRVDEEGDKVIMPEIK